MSYQAGLLTPLEIEVSKGHVQSNKMLAKHLGVDVTIMNYHARLYEEVFGPLPAFSSRLDGGGQKSRVWTKEAAERLEEALKIRGNEYDVPLRGALERLRERELSAPLLDSYTPKEAAELLGMTDSELRRKVVEYEEVFGPLPRERSLGGNGRLYGREAMRRLKLAFFMVASRQAETLRDALLNLRGREAEGAQIEASPEPDFYAQLAVRLAEHHEVFPVLEGRALNVEATLKKVYEALG